MSVILGSNPNMPAHNELSKEDFNRLKNALGKKACSIVTTWLTECFWSEQNQKGTKVLDSKNVIHMTMVLDQKINESIEFDFYADKVVAKNVPSDYKDTLKELSKTEVAAHKALVKVCIDLLKSSDGSRYGALVKDAEHIKSLKDSAIIKVAAYISMQEKLWDDPELQHLTNDKYLKMW